MLQMDPQDVLLPLRYATAALLTLKIKNTFEIFFCLV